MNTRDWRLIGRLYHSVSIIVDWRFTGNLDNVNSFITQELQLGPTVPSIILLNLKHKRTMLYLEFIGISGFFHQTISKKFQEKCSNNMPTKKKQLEDIF
jgi:hypothetical protein